MTLADVLGSIDKASRDELAEAVEAALDGHTAGEVFVVCTYFTALAIARMPYGSCNGLIEDMPRILRDIVARETETVTLQ